MLKGQTHGGDTYSVLKPSTGCLLASLQGRCQLFSVDEGRLNTEQWWNDNRLGKTANSSCSHRGGVDVWLYSFFNLSLRWESVSVSRPVRFVPPRARTPYAFTGGWVGPRVGLDRCGISLIPIEIRSPDRPAVAIHYTD